MRTRHVNILIILLVLGLGRLVHDPMVAPAPAAEEDTNRHPTTATAQQIVEPGFEKTAQVSGDWVGSIFETNPRTTAGAASAPTTEPTEDARWVIQSRRVEQVPLLFMNEVGSIRSNQQEQLALLASDTPTDLRSAIQIPFLSSDGGASPGSTTSDAPTNSPTNLPIDAPLNSLPPLVQETSTAPAPVGDATLPPLPDDIPLISPPAPPSDPTSGLGSTPPAPVVPEPALVPLAVLSLLLIRRRFHAI